MGVLVSLTREFNTLDGRSRIGGRLQAKCWPRVPGDKEIFGLLLEDGRKLEIFFTQQTHSFFASEHSDNLMEADFIDAKAIKDLNNED